LEGIPPTDLHDDAGIHLLIDEEPLSEPAPEIVAVANVPAERVEQLLAGSSWWTCESSEQGGDATQLAFSEVFPALDQQIVAPAREETPIFDTLEGSSP